MTRSIVIFFLRGFYLMFKSFIELLVGERRAHTVLVNLLSNFIAPIYFSLGLDKWGWRFEHIVNISPNRMVVRFILSDLVLVLADWEPYVKRIFNPKEDQTVLDIGAHIGLYTLRAARAVGPNGKVIAVECDPSNFNILKRNISLNRLNNVILVDCALSDTDGYMNVYLSWDPLLTTTDVKRYKPRRIRRCASIRSMTVDTLLEQLGIHKIDWMKVDVEGAEMRVLRGAVRTIEKSKDLKLIVEISEENLKEVLEYLQKFGFSLSCLSRGYYYADKIAKQDMG